MLSKRVCNNAHTWLFNGQSEKADDPAFILQPHLDQINQLFSGDTMEDIMRLLESDGSDWALKTVKTLQKMSPTSLKVWNA